jgi:hypothetical protein
VDDLAAGSDGVFSMSSIDWRDSVSEDMLGVERVPTISEEKIYSTCYCKMKRDA